MTVYSLLAPWDDPKGQKEEGQGWDPLALSHTLVLLHASQDEARQALS